jgi:HEPN domain-containing protein
MARARSDFALARSDKPAETFWEDLCFHAQQAAEKSIKAVLLHRHIAFRLVHDLEELLTTAQQAGISIPEAVRRAVRLNDYAARTRYPDDAEPVTEAEYREAVQSAEIVMAWADGQLKPA